MHPLKIDTIVQMALTLKYSHVKYSLKRVNSEVHEVIYKCFASGYAIDNYPSFDLYAPEFMTKYTYISSQTIRNDDRIVSFWIFIDVNNKTKPENKWKVQITFPTTINMFVIHLCKSE